MKRRAFTGAALGLAGGMVVSGRAGVSGWMTEAVAQEPAAGALVRKPLVLGMVLEPPALDPTAGAAAAIAEVVLYNVFETRGACGAKGGAVAAAGRALVGVGGWADVDVSSAAGGEIPERKAL